MHVGGEIDVARLRHEDGLWPVETAGGGATSARRVRAAPEEACCGVIEVVPHDRVALVIDGHPALHGTHTVIDVLERCLYHSHGAFYTGTFNNTYISIQRNIQMQMFPTSPLTSPSPEVPHTF